MTPLLFYKIRYLAIFNRPKLEEMLTEWSTGKSYYSSTSNEESIKFYSGPATDPFQNINQFMEDNFSQNAGWFEDWIVIAKRELE
jgi:hypothetical protein